MSTTLAVLVYSAAFAIPAYLLYYFGSQSWYWHALTIVAAVAMGFIPRTPQWQTPEMDLLSGFVLLFLLVWGIGGLVAYRPHHHHHHPLMHG